MRGKRLPPKEPVDAKLKDIKRQHYASPEITIVVVQCGRCGQGLVNLLRIPASRFGQPSSAIGPQVLCLAGDEVAGWRLDGNTLRATTYHLKQQRRAIQEVWAKPRTETKSIRQALAHRSRRASGPYFTQRLGKQADLLMLTETGTELEVAPQWIECPQCHADVHIAQPVAAHDDVR